MKFCKDYRRFMQVQEDQLPGVDLKCLKKILKKCRADLHSNNEHDDDGMAIQTCLDHCPVCDGTFFPLLQNEMSDVIGCFNKRAHKLLEMHLASRIRRYFMCCKVKPYLSHRELMKEDEDLVAYAVYNAIALRKILKKYDKIHYSKQGQAFKSQVQRMHMEILQSPWLCELMALHINLRETKAIYREASPLFKLEQCSLTFMDEKPTLSCRITIPQCSISCTPVKVDIDLTCPICLDTVFDPVALTCGHIFCYICACSAASVTIIDGLKAASPKGKCALCREAGVYEGAVKLEEVKILLSRNCHEYWEERIRAERAERIQQAKQHWEGQCQAFMGI